MRLHFLFMLIIFRLYYFNAMFQEVFSTLSTASTSGSVRLRMENFQILVFVISKSENGRFPFPIFFKNANPHKWQKYFYRNHEKSCNKNKIPVFVKVQISENGFYPFSLFGITKTRIRKFSVLSLTYQ